jgi:hypothetical protein
MASSGLRPRRAIVLIGVSALSGVALSVAGSSRAELGAVAVSSAGTPRILYTSDVAYPANEIYVADPSRRKPVGRLTLGKAPPCRRYAGNWCGWDAPEPSPDGRKVAAWFRHQVTFPEVTPDTATLYVLSADGRRRIPIIRNVRLRRFDDPFVRWSPDSRLVAYWDSTAWHVLRADGKGQVFGTALALSAEPGLA